MINVIANFLGIVYGQNMYADAVMILTAFCLSVIIAVSIIDMICNIIKSLIGK